MLEEVWVFHNSESCATADARLDLITFVTLQKAPAVGQLSELTRKKSVRKPHFCNTLTLFEFLSAGSDYWIHEQLITSNLN
jgi:hypothetical protein